MARSAGRYLILFWGVFGLNLAGRFAPIGQI
jgi:hypothetical protein